MIEDGEKESQGWLVKQEGAKIPKGKVRRSFRRISGPDDTPVQVRGA